MRFLVTLCLPLILLPGTASWGETLEQALIETYQNNPQLLAARAHLRATDEGVAEARSGARPTIQLSARAGYDSVSTPSSAPAAQLVTLSPSTLAGSSENWEATISQPLYKGGRIEAQTDEAELEVSAGRSTLDATEGTILYSTVQAYFDCVLDQGLYNLAVDNEQLLRTELNGVDIKVQAGVMTDPDRQQIKAQLENAGVVRSQAAGALRLARNSFRRFVGHMPTVLQPSTLRPSLPSSRDDAISQAALKNPNVVAAQFTADAGEKAIDVARSGLLPTVSIVGGYSRYYSPSVLGYAHGALTDVSIGAEITFPLYDGGLAYAQTRQARQDHQQLRHETDNARDAAIEEVGQAWDTLDTARTALPGLARAIEAANRAYEGIKREQILGTRTITDVLIAEQSLYQLRVDRLTTEHDEGLAQFNIAEQLGAMSAAALKLDVPLYDPEKHYRSSRNKWFGAGSDDN